MYQTTSAICGWLFDWTVNCFWEGGLFIFFSSPTLTIGTIFSAAYFYFLFFWLYHWLLFGLISFCFFSVSNFVAEQFWTDFCFLFFISSFLSYQKSILGHMILLTDLNAIPYLSPVVLNVECFLEWSLVFSSHYVFV